MFVRKACCLKKKRGRKSLEPRDSHHFPSEHTSLGPNLLIICLPSLILRKWDLDLHIFAGQPLSVSMIGVRMLLFVSNMLTSTKYSSSDKHGTNPCNPMLRDHVWRIVSFIGDVPCFVLSKGQLIRDYPASHGNSGPLSCCGAQRSLVSVGF